MPLIEVTCCHTKINKMLLLLLYRRTKLLKHRLDYQPARLPDPHQFPGYQRTFSRVRRLMPNLRSAR